MSKQYSEHYRPDIDGLRALAVLPVLLFHAKLGCPGGFVGVDVFFVISGFLISSLILKELGAGTFSLIAFWERRMRRIFPALVAVVLATFVAGWFLFLPEDFEKLGKSAVAQATLLSNFFFYEQWLEGTGYFAPALDPKPLLHTWSLAVEEQFYLFFPLLLLFLARWRRHSFVMVILIIAIGSFFLSDYGRIHYPAATFYLLPARAWELLLGALLAVMHGRIAANGVAREMAGWLGLGLICYPVFFYNVYDEFPGRAALPPCLGAALIIFSSESKLCTIGRILALKPVVFIGWISYSLYLWHWPLLVFSKYPLSQQSWKVGTAMLLASTVLAILSWKYVETPFRKRRIFPKRTQIFWCATISTATLLLCAFFVVQWRGFPMRFSGKALSYINSRNHFAFRNSISLDQAVAGRFPELGSQRTNQPIRILIWGDSHAMAVTPVLDELCRRYAWRGVQATHSSTAPILRHISGGGEGLGERSPAFSQAVLDFIKERHVKNVIVAAYWKDYGATDEFKTNLLLTIREVMKSGATVYVLKDVPTQAPSVATTIAFGILHNVDFEKVGITPKRHQDANHAFAETFEQISQMGATVLDPADYFLNNNGLYGVVKDGQVLYWDGHHLTVEGSRLLVPLIEPIFQANQQ